jgi:phosphate transport system substrate-binding protein
MPVDAADKAKSRAALEFFRFAFEHGERATKLDYVPLPDGLVKQIDAYIAKTIK